MVTVVGDRVPALEEDVSVTVSADATGCARVTVPVTDCPPATAFEDSDADRESGST